jgi:protein-disulfide isomerase
MRWLVIPLAVGLALPAGVAGAALGDNTGRGNRMSRENQMAHPEVLPDAMKVLQAREEGKRIAPMRAELERPFPGAVLGNPNGKVTLVEFSDYACSYCRASVADVEALIAANPELRVVVREYPILHPESVDAARMALAAAQQGRFAQFHQAMYRLGPPSGETIAAAARAAGVNLDLAQAAIAAGAFDAQLQTNVAMAQVLGIDGTPGWVAGNRILQGALGRQAIGQALREVRAS